MKKKLSELVADRKILLAVSIVAEVEGVKDTAPGSVGEILMAGGAADGPAHRASLVLQDGLRPVVGGGGKEGGGGARTEWHSLIFLFSTRKYGFSCLLTWWTCRLFFAIVGSGIVIFEAFACVFEKAVPRQLIIK